MPSWFVDCVVIAFYFTTIVSIGLFMGREEEDLGDFALGGRQIPWWAVLGSIIAAETSAGTFVGAPGEGFALRNFTYAQLAVGTIIGRVIIGNLFLKSYYRYNVFSIYEFLTSRFGPGSKNAASFVFLVTRVLASGTRLYIGAIILVLAYRIFYSEMNISPHAELLIYVAAILLLTAVTAVYTAIGGIKAVVWTDFIQAIVMIVAAIRAGAVLFHGIPGGWSEIASKLTRPEDLKIIDLGIHADKSIWQNIKDILESDYAIFAALIGSTFTTLATHGTDQDMVQRMLTAKNVQESRLSVILSGIVDVPISMLFLGLGILLYVFYQANPDPSLPSQTYEIFCYFILKKLPDPIRGLAIAGIFATTMGSLSAALNALATSFVRDWCKKQTLRQARMATVGFAVIMAFVAAGTAFVVITEPSSRIIPIVLGIFGYTYGSLLGIFLLGILTPAGRGSDLGNYIGMAAGFVAVAVLSGLPNDFARLFGSDLYTQPAWLPVVAFPWRVMFGTLVTFAVGFCFRGDIQQSVDEVSVV